MVGVLEDIATSLWWEGGSLLAGSRVVVSSVRGIIARRSLVGAQEEQRGVGAKICKSLGIRDLFPFTRLLAVCLKIP